MNELHDYEFHPKKSLIFLFILKVGQPWKGCIEYMLRFNRIHIISDQVVFSSFDNPKRKMNPIEILDLCKNEFKCDKCGEFFPVVLHAHH